MIEFDRLAPGTVAVVDLPRGAWLLLTRSAARIEPLVGESASAFDVYVSEQLGDEPLLNRDSTWRQTDVPKIAWSAE